MKTRYIHFKTISSTNKWAMEHIASFDPNQLTVVIADEQSKGRGQYGRGWFSPKNNNIYASFCVVMDKEVVAVNVTRLMATSVKQALETYGLKPTFKWPNDLLIEGKKIAGILTETVSLDKGIALVIGVGLNVDLTLTQANTIDQPATSVLIELNKLPLPASALKKELLATIQTNFKSSMLGTTVSERSIFDCSIS